MLCCSFRLFAFLPENIALQGKEPRLSDVLPIVHTSEQIHRLETKLANNGPLSILFNTSSARTILNKYTACRFCSI
jgi:hypothetical protein